MEDDCCYYVQVNHDVVVCTPPSRILWPGTWRRSTVLVKLCLYYRRIVTLPIFHASSLWLDISATSSTMFYSRDNIMDVGFLETSISLLTFNCFFFCPMKLQAEDYGHRLNSPASLRGIQQKGAANRSAYHKNFLSNPLSTGYFPDSFQFFDLFFLRGSMITWSW